MPRICSICQHSNREKINRLLVEGEIFRKIAENFSLSITSLHRHKTEHLPGNLTKAKEAQEIAKADSLLEQVKSLQNRALNILSQAEETGDLRTALGAIREARGNLELLAKLLGELNESQTVNILVVPEWIALRTKILNALDEHPEAKISVSKALESPNGSDS
ncbi:hypothetical protein MYX76_04435 [Desulfobacterota bacterium AH_259_B03_O07]|nr:hypothetical protein [Desulfobacterota bacterium AH_259_B03_O07]